jgi:hypothetical protein
MAGGPHLRVKYNSEGDHKLPFWGAPPFAGFERWDPARSHGPSLESRSTELCWRGRENPHEVGMWNPTFVQNAKVGAQSQKNGERPVCPRILPDFPRILGNVPSVPDFLNTAACVMFVVSGANKAPMLHEILENSSANLPAQNVRPTPGKLLWLVDSATASALSHR